MTVAEWLKEGRQDAGLSYEEVAFRLRAELPEALRVGSDTVRRLERREHPDPIVVAALSRVYERPLPEDVIVELRQVRALLESVDQAPAPRPTTVSGVTPS